MMKSQKKQVDPGRLQSVRAVARFREHPEKMDDLIETFGGRLTGQDRANFVRLTGGVLREKLFLEEGIARKVERCPRPLLHAVLLPAAFDLLRGNSEKSPLVIHNWVGVAGFLTSSGEAGFVNAVLRSLLRDAKSVESSLEPHQRLSCPRWLFDRWLAAFGVTPTHLLLEWQLAPPPIYLAFHRSGKGDSRAEGFETTRWVGFYRIEGSRMSRAKKLIRTGQAVIRDPFTQAPLDLLDPREGERIFDACAAPGGKASWIADRIGADGFLLATDLPGARLEKLRDLQSVFLNSRRIEVRPLDILRETPSPVPAGGFDGVLVDAPCSNTGVLRRRPDAKWRLRQEDIAAAADKQLALLSKLAPVVRPGGRLVYSTCSLEREENEHLVERFLASGAGSNFRLEATKWSRPWKDDCDGGAAFRIRREA